MNIAVRYYTKSGNTKKLAEAIAGAVGAEAQDVSVPLSEKTDILFLGSSVYAAGIDNSVKSFIKDNASNIGTIVNFSTAAILASTYKQVAELAKSNNIAIASEEFHCRGAFGPVHKGRPNADDLKKAAAFAAEFVKKR